MNKKSQIVFPPQTGNPTAFGMLMWIRDPEPPIRKYIRVQLERFPYLRQENKSTGPRLLIGAICDTLAPDLADVLKRFSTKLYLDGWQEGYQSGLEAQRHHTGDCEAVASEKESSP